VSLHILSVSPHAGDACALCLAALVPGDALLLLGDGVIAAMPGTAIARTIEEAARTVEISAIAEDCSARGQGKLVPGVRAIDYRDFVALACSQPRSISWF